MVEASSLILLFELGLLGLFFAIISFLESKAVIEELKSFHKYKFITILIFVLAVVVHTLGDVLGDRFEMQLETTGHLIIMIGAVILIQQSLRLYKLAGEYGYD